MPVEAYRRAKPTIARASGDMLIPEPIDTLAKVPNLANPLSRPSPPEAMGAGIDGPNEVGPSKRRSATGPAS